jgi:hypothetical protein
METVMKDKPLLLKHYKTNVRQFWFFVSALEIIQYSSDDGCGMIDDDDYNYDAAAWQLWL